jgi:hypothetical protein
MFANGAGFSRAVLFYAKSSFVRRKAALIAQRATIG